MIHVIARIESHPGKRAELLAHFHQLVPQVLAEEGCVEYGPAIDAETAIDAQSEVGSDAFVVIEKWASADHLKAHLGAAHMATYRETVKDLVKSVTLNVLKPA